MTGWLADSRSSGGEIEKRDSEDQRERDGGMQVGSRNGQSIDQHGDPVLAFVGPHLSPKNDIFLGLVHYRPVKQVEGDGDE
jgi:hypothetical protein